MRNALVSRGRKAKQASILAGTIRRNCALKPVSYRRCGEALRAMITNRYAAKSVVAAFLNAEPILQTTFQQLLVSTGRPSLDTVDCRGDIDPCLQ